MHFRRFRSHLGTLLLVTLVATLPLGRLLAQTAAAPATQPAEAALPAEAERAVEVLAARIDGDRRFFFDILQRRGFPPPGEVTETWRNITRMSPREAMEYAWRSAEKVAPGAGISFLRLVTEDLSMFYPGILGDLLPVQGRSQQMDFRFASLVDTDFVRPLPPNAERVIALLERYAEPHLGIVVRRCCNPREAEFRRAMRSATSVRDVLRHAIRIGEVPPELVERLARFVETVAALNPASAVALPDGSGLRTAMLNVYHASDPTRASDAAVMEAEAAYGRIAVALEREVGRELRQARNTVGVQTEELVHGGGVARLAEAATDVAGRQPFNPPPAAPLNAPVPIMPTGGGGSGANAAANNSPHGGRAYEAARNSAFDVEQGSSAGGGTPSTHTGRDPRPSGSATAPRSSFLRAAQGRAGRGGIVLGNTASGTPGLAAAASVTWVSLGANPTGSGFIGSFRILLVDGRVLFTPPLPADEAIAAVRLVFTGLPDVAPAFRPGEALGFIGFIGRFTVPSVTDTAVVPPARSNGLSFVVDPMIADTAIGRAALVTDALLIEDAIQVQNAVVARGAPSEVDRQQFRTWYRAVDWVTYRFIDRPMVVRESPDGLLRSVSSDGPNGLYLNLLRFPEEGGDSVAPIAEAAPATATALMVLIRGSSEVARLNRFAEVLATLRWARQSGGVWRDGLDSQQIHSVYSAVVLGGDQFRLIPSREAASLRIAEQVHAVANRLLNQANAPIALVDLEGRTFSNRSQLIAITAARGLMRATATSAAESRAATEYQALAEAEQAYEEAELAFRDRQREAQVARSRGDARTQATAAEATSRARERARRAGEAVDRAEQRLIARSMGTPEARVGGALDEQIVRLRQTDPAFLSPSGVLSSLRSRLPNEMNLRVAAQRSVDGALAQIPGLVSWIKFHQRYRNACPTGVCSDIKD